MCKREGSPPHPAVLPFFVISLFFSRLFVVLFYTLRSLTSLPGGGHHNAAYVSDNNDAHNDSDDGDFGIYAGIGSIDSLDDIVAARSQKHARGAKSKNKDTSTTATSSTTTATAAIGTAAATATATAAAIAAVDTPDPTSSNMNSHTLTGEPPVDYAISTRGNVPQTPVEDYDSSQRPVFPPFSSPSSSGVSLHKNTGNGKVTGAVELVPLEPVSNSPRKEGRVRDTNVDLHSIDLRVTCNPEDVADLSNLPDLNLNSITQCLEARFKKDIIYVSVSRNITSCHLFILLFFLLLILLILSLLPLRRVLSWPKLGLETKFHTNSCDKSCFH